MEKRSYLASIVLILVLIILSGCTYDVNTNDQNVEEKFVEEQETINKLRICPDAWINNQMPLSCPEEEFPCKSEFPPQYFIINGQRRELNEFDVEWIKKNCLVNKPTVVW